MRTFPAWVFLLDCDAGARVLVDTGYRTGAWHTGWRGWVYRRLVPPRVRPQESAAARLRAAGVDPASVTHVVLTHLHPDHVGGLADFPGATLVMTEGTAALGASALAGTAPASAGVLAGLLPAPFPPPGATVVGEASFTDYDVPGGPTLRVADVGAGPAVLLVDLPGHSPGHVGVLVDGRLLLAGDAAWSGDLLECADLMRALPRAITHDHAALVATARLLASARAAGVRVVLGHDAHVDAELLP